MANVYINTIGVPRKCRNGRFYGGNSFNVTNQSQGGVSAQKHIENGRLNNITAYENTIYYSTPFTVVPTGLGQIDVYRYIDGSTAGLPAGSLIKQPVLWYFPDAPSITYLDSFTIIIDASENLTGVIIEYIITE